jgi:hypothetical protein
LGIPRIFFENVDFARQALGGSGDALKALDVESNASFPLWPLFAAKGCDFGLTKWKPSEAISEYTKAFQGNSAWSCHFEECSFNGCREQIIGNIAFLRVWNCTVTKTLGDFVDNFGMNTAAWSGITTSCWIEGNIRWNLINQTGFDGIHTDFFQYTGSPETRAGGRHLVRYNVTDQLSYFSFDSNTQFVFGRFYSGSTQNFDLIVHDNIATMTAYWGVHYYSTDAATAIIDKNLFARGADTYLNEEVYPAINVETETGAGGVIKVTNNYGVTEITDASSRITTQSGNVFVDPRAAVVSGTGATSASPLRPELAYEGTFSRDGGDFMTYTVPDLSTITDRAEAFYAMADFFEPIGGWASSVLSDPSTWPTAPARPVDPFFTTSASGPGFTDQTGVTFSGNNGQFTFKAVLSVTALSGTQTIAISSGGNQLILECMSTGALRASLSDSAPTLLVNQVSTATGVIQAGVLHTIVVAADLAGQTLRIWVDGVQEMNQSLAANTGTFQTTRDVWYLRTAAGTNRLAGQITSLTWWQNVASTDGTDPVASPYKTIVGPAATANADSWRVVADPDAT